MRKFRVLIAAVMVVVIQITPGPLGLRPAHALPLLVPVVVGAAIAGIVVAGATVYKPATHSEGHISVDQVSGDISRAVTVALGFGVGVSTVLRGMQSRYVLDFDKMTDWIKDHPSDYPALSSVVDGATTYDPPVVGDVVAPHDSSSRFYITSYRTLIEPNTIRPYSLGYGTGSHYLLAVYSIDHIGKFDDLFGIYNIYQWTGTVVTDPETERPHTVSPAVFANNLPLTQTIANELDDICSDYPPAVSVLPDTFTPEQIETASKRAIADAKEEYAVTAKAAAAADPTNIALDIAARDAQIAAYEAEIEADNAETVLDVQTYNPPTTKEDDTPVPPYEPTPLAGPYELPEVDFGARLRDFITSVKSSSLFSLPTTVFGNIPGAGSSILVIEGGQIFGTHTFDFADMASMWVVLRAIVLSGFTFIAVRIVCLKR